jgi:hypothetical protein
MIAVRLDLGVWHDPALRRQLRNGRPGVQVVELMFPPTLLEESLLVGVMELPM